MYKNYILKIWVKTPDCNEFQMVEYAAINFKDIEEYIEWKRERLADKWGKNGFMCCLDTAWEVHEIYPWCKY